jgi:hypothetical protein
MYLAYVLIQLVTVIQVSGINRCQVSAHPPAKKTAGLIEKETLALLGLKQA